MSKLKTYIPLIISLGILTALILYVLMMSLDVTEGKFIYVLDDAYIHLAFAKNIVINGVAGITKYENSSSSSSPLWTLILILIFYLTGVNELVPLILNILFSFVLITLAFFFFKKYSLTNVFSTSGLLAIIIITPLILNIFTGMEHLLQTIFTISFIFLSVKELSSGESNPGKIKNSDILIFTLSALLASIRYEDLIIIVVVSLIFFFRKKYFKGIFIMISGIIPVIIYGVISVYNGGFFIPNSILLKIALPEFVTMLTGTDIFERIVSYLGFNKKIIILFTISVSVFLLQIRLKKSFLSEIPLLLFIIISIILLNKILLTASYFRYDVYIVITSIVINVIALYDYFSEKFKVKPDLSFIRKNKTMLALFTFFSIFLIYKTFESGKTILAAKNIFEQQYQMSGFVNKYYSGKEIALNDIGTVNFFADIRCTDFIGIGNNDIARERFDGSFNENSMSEIAKRNKVKISILYEKWFDNYGGIPKDWIKIGQWKISDNYICGDDAVSFYAVSKDEEAKLKNNLKSFSTELPVSVSQSGEYLK